MNFWKNHRSLRAVLMAVCFVAGLALVVTGWRRQGQLAGLGVMLAGVVLLLGALFLYNAAYAGKP